jgi:hypothetical protein
MPPSQSGCAANCVDKEHFTRQITRERRPTSLFHFRFNPIAPMLESLGILALSEKHLIQVIDFNSSLFL